MQTPLRITSSYKQQHDSCWVSVYSDFHSMQTMHLRSFNCDRDFWMSKVQFSLVTFKSFDISSDYCHVIALSSHIQWLKIWVWLSTFYLGFCVSSKCLNLSLFYWCRFRYFRISHELIKIRTIIIVENCWCLKHPEWKKRWYLSKSEFFWIPVDFPQKTATIFAIFTK